MFICLLCFSKVTLQAQSVIATTGGYGENAGAKVTWTIGEIITETIGTDPILTQGFNQSNLTVTLIKELTIPDLTLMVYPNPARDWILINTSENIPGNLRIIMIDPAGKLIKEQTLSGTGSELFVGGLPPSTYFLKVYCKKTEIAVFKIIKK